MTNNVVHTIEKHRYEITVDGVLAGFTEATEDGDVVTMPHTEVFDQFEGQGLASQLVGGALDDIRVRGKKIVPTCSYVARFVEKHRDDADLVA
jgi:predicted GNAT family acetyltransferase